jgi:hypothetical protein
LPSDQSANGQRFSPNGLQLGEERRTFDLRRASSSTTHPSSLHVDAPRKWDVQKCDDYGAELIPDPPPPDALHSSGAKTLEEGAAAIRERVAEIRRRRGS